jgi:hypothetical protein
MCEVNSLPKSKWRDKMAKKFWVLSMFVQLLLLPMVMVGWSQAQSESLVVAVAGPLTGTSAQDGIAIKGESTAVKSQSSQKMTAPIQKKQQTLQTNWPTIKKY